MKIQYLSLLFMIFLGCVSTRNHEEFLEEVSRCDGRLVNYVSYIGTKNDGDYFRHVTFWGRTVRIYPPIVPEHAKMPYHGSESEKWILVKPSHGSAILDLAYFFRYGELIPEDFYRVFPSDFSHP